MPNPPLRLRRISIEGFKAIPRLEVDLPSPLTPQEPDLQVLGSRNGHGKTSFLEACALLCLRIPRLEEGPPQQRTRFPHASFLRAGSREARISGLFTVGADDFELNLRLSEAGLQTAGQVQELRRALGFDERSAPKQNTFVDQLCNYRADPILAPPLLYFHSYRRIPEGPTHLSSLGERRTAQSGAAKRPDTAASQCKAELLRALLSQASLFEQARLFETEDHASAETLAVINKLAATYANATIRNLRPLPGNTVDILVHPNNGGAPYSFDHLGSGQKEILSTLFLIWRHTHDRPGIVLIDEPELHLNAEWRRSFVRDLTALVPHNQYLLATHAEEILASVHDRHRLLLTPNPNPSRAVTA